MSKGRPRIPVAAPDLSGNEEDYVRDAVRSTWISSTGPYLARFEKTFAEMCGTKFAIPVANGTVALHLALLALDVKPGDEVLVPSLTYIATANAVRYVGAEPVFIEVDAETWCISPEDLRSAITPKTKGMIAVHLYGHPADMDALQRIATAHGLWIVEDAAEAHFSRYKGRIAGGLGDVATFSFYGNKIIAAGEGGALTLNDASLAERISLLRGQGMDPRRRYYFPVVGYNYRLTNVAAALLCGQLERAQQIIARRRAIFDGYSARLREIPGLGFQPVAQWAEPSPWLYCITIDDEFGISRERLMQRLDEEGIETRPFFIPIHTLPPYQESWSRRGRRLPLTESLAASGLNLPTYAGLSETDLDRISAAILSARG
jgi:perosamine synthetase